jgi:hypothetical protein
MAKKGFGRQPSARQGLSPSPYRGHLVKAMARRDELPCSFVLRVVACHRLRLHLAEG